MSAASSSSAPAVPPVVPAGQSGDQTADLQVQVVRAVIDLEPRPQDKVLDPAEFEVIEFFGNLERLPPLGKFPGSVILRRFEAGDVVCRQGQPGHSAFYVLTDTDVANLHELNPDFPPPFPSDASASGRIGSIYVLAGQETARPKRWWELWRRSKSTARKSPTPVTIPNDGVVDIDPDSRCADLKQGDIFGEMSCMTFAPRSATVIVEQDCWLLELNRNIFDGLQRDKGYREYVDRLYSERTLDGQLRRLELFSGLNDSQLALLRSGVSLEVLDPGSIICEEGEQEQDPDVFLIRSGVVQVVKNAIVSLKAHEISDWTGFCKALVAAAGDGGPGPGTGAATTAPPSARSPGKLSPLELMRQKAAEKAAASAAPSPPAAAPETAAKPTPAEILARARQVKAASQSAADASEKTGSPKSPQKPEKLSTAEIMAANRRTKAPTDSPAAAAPPEALPTAEAPTSGEPTAPPPPKQKPSPAEILARARNKHAPAAPDVAASDQTAPSPSSSSKPAPAARSGGKAAELLAAARKKREEGLVADDAPATAIRPSIAGDIVRPPHAVFAWLTDRVQQAVRTLADGESDPEGAARQLVLQALNELLRSRPFLMSAPMADLLVDPSLRQRVQSCPKGVKGIKADWSDVDVRHVGRTLLTLIYPKFIVTPGEKIGAPRILGYRTRGDVIGEMALVLNAPRSATCIAYDHPPDPTGKRAPGRLELVRIKGAVFRKLMAEDNTLDSQVRELARSRTASDTSTAGYVDNEAPLASAEFHELGLFQGQKLLVIDLDSCTRCGDCMRACVETHDDGRSRLFLDGPHFDRFLIPSACRQCLNPLCMIDCPVGSIQRGSNGQIEIRDWCIGCGKCAEQCPYDSIQMHDIGIVTEIMAGWRFAPLSRVRDGWQRSRSARSGWTSGLSPFAWTTEFRTAVASLDTTGRWATATDALPEPLCFRLTFDVRPEHLQSNIGYELVVNAPNLAVEIWVNGEKRAFLMNDRDLKKGRFVVRLPHDAVRARGNLLAVQVAPQAVSPKPMSYGDSVVSMRLDPVPMASRIAEEGVADDRVPEVELVTERAVVCDLCSDLPGQEPACVSQCPHDAAMRINPLTEFGRIWNR